VRTFGKGDKGDRPLNKFGTPASNVQRGVAHRGEMALAAKGKGIEGRNLGNVGPKKMVTSIVKHHHEKQVQLEQGAGRK